MEVVTGASATGVDAQGLTLLAHDGPGGRIEARTILWAAGVEASPLARILADAAGAEVDRAGRLVVRPDLTLAGHPEVLAIGDMAALPGVPGIAPAAMQMGRHAAKAVRARAGDRRPPGDFSYLDKGMMAMIGRNRAVGVSFGVRFAGRKATLVWGLVHVRYLIGWGNRLVTVVRWMWTLLARNRAERVISLGAPALIARSGGRDGFARVAGGRP